jgi:hypothetical protein
MYSDLSIISRFANSFSKESKDLFSVFKVNTGTQPNGNGPQPITKQNKSSPKPDLDKLDLKNLLNKN